MQPAKSIKEMYICVIEKINNLKSLGKTYINKEMVRKVLQSLLRSKWGPKVMAIEEAQDLKTLKLDDVVEKFLTHVIHLKEENEEHTSQ